MEITIPDYLYEFYRKVTTEMKDVTVPELASRAFMLYAGIVTEEVLSSEKRDSLTLTPFSSTDNS